MDVSKLTSAVGSDVRAFGVTLTAVVAKVAGFRSRAERKADHTVSRQLSTARIAPDTIFVHRMSRNGGEDKSR